MEARKMENKTMDRIYRNAKALYIINVQIEDMWDYLNAKIEKREINWLEAQKLANRISLELCDVSINKCCEIVTAVINLGNEG